MNRNQTLGLSALFLAIAVFVSASLVMAVHGSYAVNGRSPTINDALHLLQKA
jgi:hypothetical protein